MTKEKLVFLLKALLRSRPAFVVGNATGKTKNWKLFINHRDLWIERDPIADSFVNNLEKIAEVMLQDSSKNILQALSEIVTYWKKRSLIRQEYLLRQKEYAFQCAMFCDSLNDYLEDPAGEEAPEAPLDPDHNKLQY